MELKSIHRLLNWKIVTKVRFAHEIVNCIINQWKWVNHVQVMEFFSLKKFKHMQEWMILCTKVSWKKKLRKRPKQECDDIFLLKKK